MLGQALLLRCLKELRLSLEGSRFCQPLSCVPWKTQLAWESALRLQAGRETIGCKIQAGLKTNINQQQPLNSF